MVNEPLHFIILAERNKSGAEKMGIPSPPVRRSIWGGSSQFFCRIFINGL